MYARQLLNEQASVGISEHQVQLTNRLMRKYERMKIFNLQAREHLQINTITVNGLREITSSNFVCDVSFVFDSNWIGALTIIEVSTDFILQESDFSRHPCPLIKFSCFENYSK